MVPEFNEHGLLPVFVTTGPDQTRYQSPYPCTMEELRGIFGGSQRRQDLINGLDRYRADLRETGFRVAFQWVSGSLIELGAEPNDIDLVNFFYPPKNQDGVEAMKAFVLAHGDLFHKPDTKRVYGCEPNFVALGSKPSRIVMTTAYWTTLFGISRSGLPRGFLVLPGLGGAPKRRADA